MNIVRNLLLCALACIPMQSMPMHVSAYSKLYVSQTGKCSRCGIADPKQFTGCNFQKIIGANNFHATFFKKNASMINGLKKEIRVSRFDDAVRALQKNNFHVDVYLGARMDSGSFRDCQGNLCYLLSSKINHINK